MQNLERWVNGLSKTIIKKGNFSARLSYLIILTLSQRNTTSIAFQNGISSSFGESVIVATPSALETPELL